MSEGESGPVPRLRRDPHPTNTNGRKALIGVAVFFVLLVGFVLTLVFTIGVHNNGVKLPPSPTSPSAATSPALHFFAIDAATGGKTYVDASATYSSYQHHQRAVAMGVAPDGRTAYYAVPVSGCRTAIDKTVAGRSVVTSRVGVIDGRVLGVAMAVNTDGSQLAFVETPPAARRSTCGRGASVFAFDLKHHHVQFVENIAARLPVSLAWVPGVGLASLANGTVVERRVGCPSCTPIFRADTGNPLGALLMWDGHLAAVVSGAIREIGGAGLGPTLATGLPDSVVSATVDPSGKRLLVWGGLQTVKDPGHISFRTTYVWSAGKSTYVPGEWIDPAW